MSEKMIKQIKKLLFDYTEVYDDEPILIGLLLIINDNYISKDKIREKIKCCEQELEHIKKGEEFENEKDFYEYRLLILKELLEE